MKTFLLGFAEGYFTVSLIIYIATYLILKNPINTLFYPEIYPVLFGLFFYHLSSISRALSKKRDKTVAILRLLSYFYHLLIHKKAC